MRERDRPVAIAINSRVDLADTLNAPVSPGKVRRGVYAPGVSLQDATRPPASNSLSKEAHDMRAVKLTFVLAGLLALEA